MIEKLQFDQIEYIKQCSEAPNGAIIQMLDGKENILVGMRTSFKKDPSNKNSSDAKAALLIISGEDSGLVKELLDIGDLPAFVITKLVRFVAIGILPRPEIGNLLHLATDGAILARAKVEHQQQPGTQLAYVCLRSGNKGGGAAEATQRGTCLQSPVNNADLRIIAQSFELELIPEFVVGSAR